MIEIKKFHIQILILILRTLVIAIAGALIANFIHLPIPWLLGSMVSVLIASRMGLKLYWPRRMRDIAIVIVGYSIGLSFTKDALRLILIQLPSIFLATIFIIGFCVALAYLISKITGLDYPSVLIGSIPGGLSQMLLLGEEIKGVNLSIVTFLQVSRLILIIIFVPLLVFSPLVKNGSTNASMVIHSPTITLVDLFPNILVFIPVVLLSIILAKKFKFPTPYLVGPIFGTAIVGLVGFQGPSLPSSVLDVSQLMIGSYIGLLIHFEEIEHKLKMVGVAISSGVLLLLGSWGLSWLFAHMKHISFSTSALSLAPGGMDQMGIIAAEIHADLSIVAGYQLFRLFFIFFVVPPILRIFIHHLYRKKGLEPHKIEV
ncbi:AbrB family transcriptional regulator [Bacillaceae bacterium CLA-AA-H227]|uniref:AbrB family transcriptional regulator n=1 Tax=Robertmurraya yapensis (ex Hitch et al 2024) TaxID=3133160 RepID=A0ACC6S777_9BACI